ncbi:MAG: diazepam-binding inhibitor (GABA receptor modulating acyl-CoA-binding protein) [Myxococcota bacterium]|jgi:diazepam-binding inhibitor (GABA receptor modulating acyl-CoA-binding protein)
MDNSELKEAFDDALLRVKMLPSQPGNVLLNMYGLYKQATTGDASGKRPGMTDFRGRAKFDAWVSRKGMSQEDAMVEYVDYAEELGA